MFSFGIIAENFEVLQNVTMWTGFDSGLNALLELNLMVLYSALRGFSTGSRVFLSANQRFIFI